MNNMNLSKNFTLDELTETTTGLPNVPFQDEIDNLKLLTTKVLQPARDYMGIPISISSGYRSPLVNKKVKGAVNSAHMYGRAADLKCGSKALNEKLYNWIKNNCEFRQLINEYNYSWVHVEYNIDDNKKQELKIK